MRTMVSRRHGAAQAVAGSRSTPAAASPEIGSTAGRGDAGYGGAAAISEIGSTAADHGYDRPAGSAAARGDDGEESRVRREGLGAQVVDPPFQRQA